MTIRLPPPPGPEPAPRPCPNCGGREAVPLYATSRVQYLRCASCRQVWTLTVSPESSPAAA